MRADVPGSDATRQRDRPSLRAALTDAIREGVITVNPAALSPRCGSTRKRQMVDRIAWGSAWVESGKVFVARMGKHCTRRSSPIGSTTL